MSRKELTLMRRAYLLGYRRGLNRALMKMTTKAQAWEDEIQMLEDRFQMLCDDVRSVRDAQAVQQAANERATIEDGWLN